MSDSLAFQVCSGSQQHFYMEPICALAVPEEGGRALTLHCPTQSPEGAQKVTAKCLGIPQHCIRVITKRLGGSFGGKINRSSQVIILA